MKTPSLKQIEAALYTDESGEVIGLDEVQLLDNPPLERFNVLQNSLQSGDLEIRYRSAIVLAAWGDDQGMDAIENMIDSRVDKNGVCVPHRIYGYNNIYDEFAYALYLFGNSGKRKSDQNRVYIKLLNLYGPCDFESRLKNALLIREFYELISDIERACERALSFNKPYLASQLLPVLAKLGSESAWRLVPSFVGLPIQTPNPVANVAEALGYIDSGDSRALLQKLCDDPDAVVAEQAEKALMNLD